MTPEFAWQFEQRNIFPRQEIQKIDNDGGLIISSFVKQPREIVPIIQYWLPHVLVMSPDSVKDALLRNLKQALNELGEST